MTDIVTTDTPTPKPSPRKVCDICWAVGEHDCNKDDLDAELQELWGKVADFSRRHPRWPT